MAFSELLLPILIFTLFSFSAKYAKIRTPWKKGPCSTLTWCDELIFVQFSSHWFGPWSRSWAEEQLPEPEDSEQTEATHHQDVLGVVLVGRATHGVPLRLVCRLLFQTVQVKVTFVKLIHTEIFVLFQNLEQTRNIVVKHIQLLELSNIKYYYLLSVNFVKYTYEH